MPSLIGHRALLQHGPLARPLSSRFVDMNRDLPIVAPGALRFLLAVATALPRGHIHMRSIYGIDTDVGKPLSSLREWP